MTSVDNEMSASTISGVNEAAIPGSCPCCHGLASDFWAEEAGFVVVRCRTCRLLFVNPAPSREAVNRAVRTGEQDLQGRIVNVRARHLPKKVEYYRKRLLSTIGDIIEAGKPVHWVDVGSGYGEFIDALQLVLPKGSRVEGVEPMTHKASEAAARGLTIHNQYLERGQFQADFISNIDVFSHIPDYAGFLETVVSNLKPDGEFLMETGNTADLEKRSELPAELGLPDHLVFAGKRQLEMYLNKAGLKIRSIREDRFDTLLQMTKNLVKLVIGRDSNIAIPYTSDYRQLIIRAERKR